MRLLFMVRRAGPYHGARYERCGKVIDLSVIETRPAAMEYPWTSKVSARSYRVLPLATQAVSDAGIGGRELDDAVRRRFDEIKPDVVACTGWADREYHAALRRCHALGVPAVVMSDSTFSDEPRSAIKEFMKSRLIRAFSSAVVAGARSRSYLCRLGFAPDAIFEPWDVVDNTHFAYPHEQSPSAEATQAAPYFLCVSRFLPKKNLFRLLEAFSNYRRLHGAGAWNLVILGSGELAAKLSAAIGAAGMQDYVRLPGFVQYDELPSFYRGAGALVLPSLSDQWGLAVNEAMAAGVPVIVSTACGCATDLVAEGECGFTFDPGDVLGLARLMHGMASFPEAERRRLGENGRDRISRYTPERFAEALVAAANHARGVGRTAGFATRMTLRVSAFRR
jgi:1,2-diacylglycerol 3-alpha-glucosyltransferase